MGIEDDIAKLRGRVSDLEARIPYDGEGGPRCGVSGCDNGRGATGDGERWLRISYRSGTTGKKVIVDVCDGHLNESFNILLAKLRPSWWQNPEDVIRHSQRRGA